jgi:hypothetical protein
MMTDHFVDQIRELGVSTKSHGCEVGEGSHRDFVHRTYKMVSGRRGVDTIEMKKRNVEIEVAKCIQNILNQDNKVDDEAHGDIKISKEKSSYRLIPPESPEHSYTLQERDGKGTYKDLRSDDVKKQMHFKLTPETLWLLLQTYWNGCPDFVNCADDILSRRMDCLLHTGLSFQHSKNTRVYIKAEPMKIFNKLSKKIETYTNFSFVEIDGVPHKVIAIVEWKLKMEKKSLAANIVVVVWPMKHLTNRERKNDYFPYDMYGFSSEQLKLVQTDKILPSMVIPARVGRSYFFKQDARSSNSIMYHIKHERLEKGSSMTYAALKQNSLAGQNIQDYDQCFSSEETINKWADERDKLSEQNEKGKEKEGKKQSQNHQNFENTDEEEDEDIDLEEV